MRSGQCGADFVHLYFSSFPFDLVWPLGVLCSLCFLPKTAQELDSTDVCYTSLRSGTHFKTYQELQLFLRFSITVLLLLPLYIHLMQSYDFWVSANQIEIFPTWAGASSPRFSLPVYLFKLFIFTPFQKWARVTLQLFFSWCLSDPCQLCDYHQDTCEHR